MVQEALIRMQMLGVLEHRDVALRAVSAACKLVSRRPQRIDLSEFRTQVVSAVGEAFNNIVLHGYAGRDDGVIELDIETAPGRIKVELRDYGESFDLDAIPVPDLELLPESGLGIFIIKAFMHIRYRPGSPNVLILTKSVVPDRSAGASPNPSEDDSASATPNPSEGDS